MFSKISSLLLLSSLLMTPSLDLSASPNEVEARDGRILISNLKGIALCGTQKNLGKTTTQGTLGVQFVDLDVPGNRNNLEGRLSKYLNRPLTQDDLYKIEKTIVTYYQHNERPLVMVKIPGQETSSGVLRVYIFESMLAEVQSTGCRWFSDEKIASYIRLKPGDEIDEGTLLQDLFWMNRNPFHKTDVIYTAGKADGTTIVKLVTKDRFPLRTYVGTDNTGLDTIGRNRMYGGLNWGNVFGLDHFMTYQYTASYNIHRFQAHTVHYTAPLSWRHVFIVFGGYSTDHAHIPVKHFKGSGSSYQASGRYTVPIHCGTKLLHDATLGFDFKRTNNTVEFSETPVFGKLANLTQFLLEYSLGYETKMAKTSFVGSLFFSPAEMVGDQSRADFESLRPFAQTKYVYFKAGFAEVIRFDDICAILMTFRGQISSANLLPSEQFGLGGYDTVRGYEERIINFDNAVVANLELRSPPIRVFTGKKASTDESLQFLVFCDYGFGGNHRPVSGEKRTRYLLSAGPGVRYNLTPYLSARFDYGFKFKDVPFDGAFGRPHFSVTVGY